MLKLNTIEGASSNVCGPIGKAWLIVSWSDIFTCKSLIAMVNFDPVYGQPGLRTAGSQLVQYIWTSFN